MTDELLTLVRSLDPADPADVVPSASGARARADLARILASEPVVAGPRRRPARRLVAGVAAVATAGAAAVLVPSALGGDAAFASWQPSPRKVVGAARAEAAGACRDRLRDVDPGATLDRTTPAVAEQRGDWTLVLLSGAPGYSALCITDDSRRLFDDMIGSVGTADAPHPGPRGLTATDLGSGTMDAGTLSLVAGLAGSDVVAVAYPSARHGRVEASLGEGRFALWFPGDELAGGGPVRLEVTYADGSRGRVDVEL
ncbi:hypothetical protein [Nocardioides kongjuensis]|uniref:Uncharacterized protein n=2 Tax=Nocardioides kongjuensis TaxID=349522 RepID=A0A852RSG2_9ACTN|nr:hypothetical protein [Nocardioides kongjuensis]NYD30864.1 hypothetical protein [Nocardioides kongjuensis]